MYDYSGFYAKIINPWFFIILLSIFVIVMWRIVDKNLNLKSKEFIIRAIIPFAMSGIAIISLLLSMWCAEVKSTTAVFLVKQNRGFNAAPMFSDTYNFETSYGDEISFDMDHYAMQRICSGDLNKKSSYLIYYKESFLNGNIIIGIKEATSAN